MEVSTLLSLPQGLEIASLSAVEKVLTIHLVATASSSACPLCSQAATRIHSHYTRLVADVACGGRQVQLLLHVRKFRCDTSDCPRKIFTERLAPFLEPWARMTTRLCQAIQAIGLATCGELGARLANRLGIGTSPTTILRSLMALPFESVETVSCLGVDDFSFRRGRRFGTILVDLETHQVLDLLADRSAQTTASWMKAHPEIKIVSRDRGEDYAAAARSGAPQATQVADRFHLAQNLTEIVEAILARCSAEIRKASRQSEAPRDRQAEGEGEQAHLLDEWLPAPDPHANDASLARQIERTDRYQQLVELRRAGLTIEAIAQRLGMAERTVRSWLKRGIPYTMPRRKRQSCFDPYAAYVAERWKQGCRNGLQLWRELKAQGYQGSGRTVYRFLASLRENPAPIRGKAERAQAIAESPLQQFTARDAVWLFVRAPSNLDETEREELAAIRQASPTADTVYELVQDFMTMLRHRQGDRLESWLGLVKASQIHELQRLVQSIERDKAAVVAGLTLPHNNGLVEGKVNKLKLIKRIMFGRAGFPLLRQRVLHAL